uniref:Gamma-glutamylcyclotransferase family protein n=1 Tax=Aegilops tauschii TaxID=37682 RepID=M8BMC2_AEGTA
MVFSCSIRFLFAVFSSLSLSLSLSVSCPSWMTQRQRPKQAIYTYSWATLFFEPLLVFRVVTEVLRESRLADGQRGSEAIMEAASAASAATATATMVFVYGTLKRGFPNYPRLAAFDCPFAGAGTTAAPASLVIGPYSVPFLLPTPTPSSGRLVSGELYSASPSALADLDLLEGTHLGVYERRRITVVVDGASKEVEAQAYFANASYAEFLWLRCGGEAAEIAEYTMEHAGRYVPPSGRSPGVSGLMDAVRAFLATAPPEN